MRRLNRLAHSAILVILNSQIKRKRMKVIIVSPEKVLYQGEASSVVVPGEKGRFEILDHHAPIISTLTEGTVVCRGNAPVTLAVRGGFVDVACNEVSICVEEESK